MTSESREAIMKRLRAAASRPAERDSSGKCASLPGNAARAMQDTSPDPAGSATQSLQATPLYERFARELEALGGRANLIDSVELAAEQIASLLAAKGIHSLALGPGVLTSSVATRLRVIGGRGSQLVLLDTAAETSTIAQAPAGLIEAKGAVAASGTIILDTAERLLASLLPPLLIALLPAEQIAANTSDAIALASNWIPGGRLTMVTGPSRTADIEKKLVLGVHGPKDLAVLVLQTSGDYSQ